MSHSLHLPYLPHIHSRNVRLYELIWRDWLAARLAEGVPRQRLYDIMFGHWRTLHPSDATGEAEALHLVWNELAAEFLERNFRGSWHEERGQVDEAIALYEANVQDAYALPQPYERLRIIYTEREDWDDVV